MHNYQLDIYEIRAQRLRELIDSDFQGNQTLFARTAKISQPQLNRWLSKTAADTRRITEDSARDIEKALGKPYGWLDSTEETSKLLSMFSGLDDTQKRLVLMQVEAIYKLHKKP